MGTISQITGKGELPIEKMPGFREPTPGEKILVQKRIKKNINKDTLTTTAWTVISLAFVVMYLFMMIRRGVSMFFIVAMAMFLGMAIFGIVHLLNVDVKTSRAVEAGQFTLRYALVDHIASGFTTVGGKAAAKVKDENGNVYSQEFALTKRAKKVIKANLNKEFLVIRVQSGMYCLLCDLKKDVIRDKNGHIIEVTGDGPIREAVDRVEEPELDEETEAEQTEEQAEDRLDEGFPEEQVLEDSAPDEKDFAG